MSTLRVTLVIGGARGIGGATAVRLAARGDAVVMVDAAADDPRLPAEIPPAEFRALYARSPSAGSPAKPAARLELLRRLRPTGDEAVRGVARDRRSVGPTVEVSRHRGRVEQHEQLDRGGAWLGGTGLLGERGEDATDPIAMGAADLTAGAAAALTADEPPVTFPRG